MTGKPVSSYKYVDDKWCSVKVGDIIFNSDKIIPTNNPSEYRFEIKTTGESFAGCYTEVNKYISEINNIIESYFK